MEPKDVVGRWNFKRKETVNHPAHYGGAENPYEHVKIMEATLTTEQFTGGMIYQVTKYLQRAGKKTEDPIEDYQKAAWYLNRLVAFLENKDHERQ
jgi:hypothetical protein